MADNAEVTMLADLTTMQQLLPPRLQEFVRLIGLPATMRMVERFGGLRIYIPADPTPDHAFVEIIGFDNLVKLSREYAINGIGLRFELPKATMALMEVRNASIRADFDSGAKSTRMLAAEHRLHERQITRILATVAPTSHPQATLFA